MESVDAKKRKIELSITKTLFKNTYVKLIRNIVLMVQGVFLASVVIGVFGVNLSGVWFLITQFSAYLYLVEFGIPSGLTRLHSRSTALNDTKEANDIAVVSFVLLAVLAIVLVLNTNQLSELFFHLFDKIERNESVEFAVMFGILATSLSIPFRCGVGLLEANHLFYIHLWVEIIFVTLRLIVLCAIYMNNVFDIEILSIIYFSTTFGIPFIQLLLCVKARLIVLSCRASSFNPKYFKRLVSLGVAITLITASSTTLRQGSPMILGALDGAAAAALFSLVMLVVTSIMQFLTVAVSFIGPQASQIIALGDSQRLYLLFLDYSKYSLAIAVHAGFFFFFFGEALLRSWLSLDFASISSINDAVIILLFTLPLSVPALYGRTVLTYIDRHAVTSASEFLVVLVGLSLGMLAVHKFELGVIGMAYGIAAVFLLRAFGPVFFIFTNRFKKTKIRYLVDVYWSNLIPLILTTSFVGIAKLYIDVESLGWMYFCYAVFSIFCLILLQWVFVVKPEHQAAVKKTVAIYAQRLNMSIFNSPN
ncbi:hypothetical protein OAU68_00740 [Litorivicinus sp.]|nr:hypothetical protein [Litorivicinus sp.]